MSSLSLVYLQYGRLYHLGCGILLAPWLDQFKLIGTEYPLGFWFAQQGSIYVFVILIVIYVVVMNRIDSRFSKGDHQ